MSTFTRLYEQAIKQGNLEYQRMILSNEITRLRERQRSIERARRNAEKQGVNSVIIDIAVEPEFVQNKKWIAQLIQIREQTKQNIRANKSPKVEKVNVQSGIALNIGKRISAKQQKLEQEYRPSERTIAASIKRSSSKAVEEVISRMIYKGQFMQVAYTEMLALEQDYGWVFDILGHRLSDKFKQDIAQNYSSYASDIAFDFFNTIDNRIPTSTPTVREDGTIDGEHTIEEYQKTLQMIINTIKGAI